MIWKINSDQWLMVSEEVVAYRATVSGDDFQPFRAVIAGRATEKRHASPPESPPPA
jgi:hypothetical protein